MGEKSKLDVYDDGPSKDKVQKMINIGLKLNAGKVTLRISPTITILVKPENDTEDYANKYRERMRIHNMHI